MYIVTSFFDSVHKMQRSNTLLRDAFRGVVAGAMGTATLNIATYADMAIRGRPSSNAPSKTVETLANTLHLPLSAQGDNANDQVAENRESGLGALLGFVNGLSTGAAYGLVRSQLDDLPVPLMQPVIRLGGGEGDERSGRVFHFPRGKLHGFTAAWLTMSMVLMSRGSGIDSLLYLSIGQSTHPFDHAPLRRPDYGTYALTEPIGNPSAPVPIRLSP